MDEASSIYKHTKPPIIESEREEARDKGKTKKKKNTYTRINHKLRVQ